MGKRKDGMGWAFGNAIYTILCIRQITNEK